MTWRWRIHTRLGFDVLGECCYERRTIYINAPLIRRIGRHLLPTCIHEDLHRVFPEKTEWEVQDLTADIMALLSARDRRLLTARYRRKLGI